MTDPPARTENDTGLARRPHRPRQRPQYSLRPPVRCRPHPRAAATSTTPLVTLDPCALTNAYRFVDAPRTRLPALRGTPRRRAHRGLGRVHQGRPTNRLVTLPV